MKSFVSSVVLTALILGPGGSPAAESERPRNLQFFPEKIEEDELISEMRKFSFALGVACTHCHGTIEQTGFNLTGVDFSADIKPQKAKARQMLRMTARINELLDPIPDSDLDLMVTCFTCHSGLALPEAIEDRMVRMVTKDGVELAIADYRATREGYYGSAAFNFREQPLVEAAATLIAQGRFDAAARVSLLNLEFYPESIQTMHHLANAYFQAGDKKKARTAYGEILDRRPQDRRALARIKDLGIIKATTSDGVTIHGETYLGDLDASTPLILLFHQAGSNGRGEYAELARWLNASGFRAIAWDQRVGGERYGESNRTAAGLAEGASPSFCDAYPDLQAALDAVTEGGLADKVVVWGSSYSASLVFRLAAENPERVAGVIAFSPASGGPMVDCRARNFLADVKAPAAAFRPASEMERESSIEQRAVLTAAGVEFHVVEKGVHGSSMLVDSRTEQDMSGARHTVLDWLGKVTGHGHRH